nr:DNA/RNA non-specific endonuclease [Marininema mesophilum]
MSSSEAKIQLNNGKRNGYAQTKVGGEGRLSDDDGGHLLASIFGGSGNIDNLVPMNANLNRGAWKKMENAWAASLKDGQEVHVKINPKYKGDSKRPDRIEVRHKTGDGQWVVDIFKNIPGGK